MKAEALEKAQHSHFIQTNTALGLEVPKEQTIHEFPMMLMGQEFRSLRVLSMGCV